MLRRTYSRIRIPFLIALESPFSPMFSTVISPSTALWRKIDTTYLLFLIGFLLLYAYEKKIVNTSKQKKYVKKITKKFTLYLPQNNAYDIIA